VNLKWLAFELKVIFGSFTQWLLLGFFVKKVFETSLNFRYQPKEIGKNKGTIVVSSFKIDII